MSLLVAACGGSGSGTAPPPVTDFCAVARELRAQIPGGGVGLTEEEEADLTARTIPGGFGGLFQEFGRVTPGRLVFRLKDLGQSVQASSALIRVLSCGAVYPGWANVLVNLAGVQVEPGDYTATELLAFLRALAGVRSDPDVWAVVVDPERNRIWIGVETVLARPRVEQAVVAAAVPLGAVVVEPPPPGESISPPFEVEGATHQVVELTGLPGLIAFSLPVRFTNLAAKTRYIDQCARSTGAGAVNDTFLFRFARWDGVQWVNIYAPICEAVLFLVPLEVVPGGEKRDTADGIGSRRLKAEPWWHVPRITGTYRFEGFVYRTKTDSAPFLADLVPLEERVSAPFRLVR